MNVSGIFLLESFLFSSGRKFSHYEIYNERKVLKVYFCIMNKYQMKAYEKEMVLVFPCIFYVNSRIY